MSILVGSWVAPETQTQSTQDLTQIHKIFLGLKSGFMYSVYSKKKEITIKKKDEAKRDKRVSFEIH
jgi:hypothetical protein